MELQIGTKILVNSIPGRMNASFKEGKLPFEAEIVGLPNLDTNSSGRVLICENKNWWRKKDAEASIGWDFQCAPEMWRLFNAKKINQPVLYISQCCFSIAENQPNINHRLMGVPMGWTVINFLHNFTYCKVIGYSFEGYYLLTADPKDISIDWTGPDLNVDVIEKMDRISGPDLLEMEDGIKYRIIPEPEILSGYASELNLSKLTGSLLQQYT